jgi:hypothetical protein
MSGTGWEREEGRKEERVEREGWERERGVREIGNDIVREWQ